MLPPRAERVGVLKQVLAQSTTAGATRHGSRENASLSARLTRGRSAAATINAKRRQFYYRCHGKRAGSGASVRRSLAAEKQYPQPTRGSWSGLQPVGESEACIPEIEECGAPDHSQLQRNADSHAHRHGHSCPSAPAMQHSGGADLTAARPPSAASHELLSSKHKSSSLAGIARTAASGVEQRPPRGEEAAQSRLSPISRTCLQVSGSRKTSTQSQSGAVAAAGTRVPPRAVAMLSPRGRHAEAGIVVGGLASLAMRRGMAVTVDATVPDPWRSEASVAVAAEGWMTGQRPSRSLVPKHRLALPVACTPTTSRCVHDRRESRMQPSTSTATAQPRARPGRAGRSRRLMEPLHRASCSWAGRGGQGRRSRAPKSPARGGTKRRNPPPADHFFCAWAGCPAPPVGLDLWCSTVRLNGAARRNSRATTATRRA